MADMANAVTLSGRTLSLGTVLVCCCIIVLVSPNQQSEYAEYDVQNWNWSLETNGTELMTNLGYRRRFKNRERSYEQNESQAKNMSRFGRRRKKRLCYSKDGSLLWEKQLEIVVVPILVIFGLVGNTLSFFVWNTPAYRRKSYAFYLRALAVFDNLTLLFTLTITANEMSWCMTGGNFLAGHTVATCKLTEYLRRVAYLMSSWMVACFTIDRYVAVCHPLKRLRLCTAKGSIVTIVILAGVAMLCEIYAVVFVERTMAKRSNRVCGVPKTVSLDPDNGTVIFSDFQNRIVFAGLEYFWFSFTLRFLLPFAVIAVCNGYIIMELRRMRCDPIGREHARRSKANMAIYTLFLICVLFVITLLPHAVLSMVWFLILVPRMSSGNNVRRRMYFWAVKVGTPFEVVLLLNYSTNFIMYGLSGSQFRKALASLCRCRQRDPVQPSNEMLPLKNPSSTRTRSRETLTTHL